MNKQEGQFKKGDLSIWTNIAISNLIQGHNTHAHSTQNANPYQIPKGRLKVKNLMQDICKRWIDSGIRHEVNPGMTIPVKQLDQTIREVTGHHDKRAIHGHIDDLVKFGYITDKGYAGALMIKDTGTDIEWIEGVMEQQKHDERQREKEQQDKQKGAMIVKK